MARANINIQELQFVLDKSTQGFCLSVALLNYDELRVMEGSAHYVIEALNGIIDKTCSGLSINLIHKTIDLDRLLLVLPDIDAQLARSFSEKIYWFSQLYTHATIKTFYMHCHISAIEFPKDTNKAEEVVNLLNFLQSQHNNSEYYRFYDPKLHNAKLLKHRNTQLYYLRKALANKTMVFAYQPIIDRISMKIHYYECLLRVSDQDGNLISVGPIITEAENKGLIFVIDQIALEMAIKELACNVDLKLAVNISNIGIANEGLLELAENLLQTHNVSGRLIIEITETSFNDDYDKITFVINKLHKFGCKFALDDFGAGFTSFKQLQNLPIDIVKIDGSYVRDIISNMQSQEFVERLIKISEELGICTVAEFVENGEIAQFLINLKIDSMQGNFFSEASLVRMKEYTK